MLQTSRAPSRGRPPSVLRSNKRISLTPKQGLIYAWGWQPDARFRDVCAGRRFGKTFLMMEELRRAVRLAVERDIDTDNEIWYGAPTLKQGEKNFWKRALRSCPPEWIAHVNNAKLTITFHSGHVFRLVGLDNYDDLRGSGLFFAMLDEYADVKPEAWTEVIRPMLSTCNGHALRIGTPKGFNHFYDRWVEGQPGAGRLPDSMSWKFTTLDGGNVPEAEIEAARNSMDERTFRQEYMASWESYSGVIYYAFDRRENVMPPPWAAQLGQNYNPAMPVHIGLDFNINPMTAHIYQELRNGNRIDSYQIDEIHILSSNTHEIGNEISRRYGKHDLQKPLDHIWIYPDPAGAGRRTAAHGETDISILRKMGFHVMAMSSHPLVRDRINLVNGKLCSMNGVRSLFTAPSCKRTIEAFEKHLYKEGTSEPDKDSGFDHDNDATGYYVYTRFAHQKARPESVVHMAR